MSTASDRRMARTLVTLADTLVADFDEVDFLALLAERTVELLDVDVTGVVLSDQRGGWQPAGQVVRARGRRRIVRRTGPGRTVSGLHDHAGSGNGAGPGG